MRSPQRADPLSDSNRALIQFAEFQRLATVRQWESILQFSVFPIVDRPMFMSPPTDYFVAPINDLVPPDRV